MRLTVGLSFSRPELTQRTLHRPRLPSSTATFNAFDKERRGRVELNFNQFLFATAHCV